MGLLEPMHIIILMLVFIGLPAGAVCVAISAKKVMSGTEAFFWGFLFNVIGLVVVLLSKNRTEIPNFQFESTPDQIKKYKDLLDSGAITESEYNAQKSKLLNQ